MAQQNHEQPVEAIPLHASVRTARRLLSVQNLQRFSVVNDSRSLALIFGEWASIVVCSCWVWHHWHPLLYVLAVAFLGARQHALLVLIHDAAHYRLFRNRRVNDWVAEALLALPFLVVRVRDYRTHHSAHHRWLNTNADPDWLPRHGPEWTFPQRPLQLLRSLAEQLLGVGLLAIVFRPGQVLPARVESKAPDDRAMLVARSVALIIVAIVVLGKGLVVPVVLFWLVPFATWLQFVMRLRAIADHYAIERVGAKASRDGLYEQTRSTVPTLFDRVFLASYGSGYHLEHHLFPSVPGPKLAALHELLMTVPEYARDAHVTHGYWRVVLECLRQSNQWHRTKQHTENL